MPLKSKISNRQQAGNCYRLFGTRLACAQKGAFPIGQLPGYLVKSMFLKCKYCLLVCLALLPARLVWAAGLVITAENSPQFMDLGGPGYLACWAKGHQVGRLSTPALGIGATFRKIKVKPQIKGFKLKLLRLNASLKKAKKPAARQKLKQRQAALRVALSDLKSAAASCRKWRRGPEAIAVWAYPDGVSVPYRDESNQIISSSSAQIGVVAYHANAIERVEFAVRGTLHRQTVRQESINPETGEYEYVFVLDPARLGSDGPYEVVATAFPKSGNSHRLPALIVQKDTAAHNAWHLDPVAGSDSSGDGTLEKPFATLTKGFAAAQAGDLIVAASGNYAWPVDKKYRYTKYVTLRAAADNHPVVLMSHGEHINWEFVKIQGFQFRVTQALQGGLQAFEGHHLWFQDCSFEGVPGSHIYFERPNSRALWTLGPVHHVVAERVITKQFAAGLSLVGAGHSIVRQSHAEQLNDTPVMVQKGEVLVTSNTMTAVGLNYRNLAWSVSKNAAAQFDFGAGAELILMFSKDKGETYSESARVTLSGTLSAQQVVELLNSDSNFAADFSARLSEDPYPLAGHVLILDKTNSEYHWFYLAGAAASILQFSDNTPDLNDLSAVQPAKNGATHFDYIANTSGDFANVVYRNNKGFNSQTLGLKFGQISKTDPDTKKNIAVINNILVTISAHVMFSESNYQGQTTFDNFLIEHNLLWNTGGGVNSVTNFPTNIRGLNWTIRNNIIGRYHAYDYSSAPYGWGHQDYNLQYQGTAVGAHGLVGDPLFVGGLPGEEQSLEGFRLEASSPAVDQADPNSSIKYDIDFRLRDAKPDIGPYER